MTLLKKITFACIVFIFFANNLKADSAYYLDFKYILNQSIAGKEAQNFLKKKLDSGIKKLKEEEKGLQVEEQKIIKQKKLISAEEYKKSVTNLRQKVSKLQKDRNKLLKDTAELRSKARAELLKNLNPIIKEYMQEKKIRMVLDKKSLLLADENLDITKDILKILNNKLKSVKLS